MANRPRMAVLTLIAALLLTLAAAGCTFTGDSRDEAGTPAPAEVSPEPTAAAAPMPQRYTRSFGSADGTVKYSMDLSLDEAAAETMPTLKLKPRAISEAEAKSTVRLVLGDAELYGCDAEDYSKEELERYLDVVKLLRDDGELRQRLYGDSAAQERIANLLAKYDTQSVYDAAPYDSERPPLDWSYLPDGNARRTITGKAELDGWRYYLSATDDQRESGLQRGVWVYLDAGYLASVPYEYYCYALAADSVPAAEQVDYAAAKAQRIIDGLDIGQWQIVLSGAQETYGGRYNIYVDAAPVFDGYPVLHRSYDEYYHQRNIGFTFGADGTLIHFLLVNPSEAAEYISAGDSVLSIAEAAEIAEKALTGVSKEAFDISYVTVDGSLQYGVRSEVTVDSVSYGYAQVPTEGGKGESVLTPIISFSGHFEAYDEAGKPVFSSAERGFTEVINLNAIDGSVLSIGYMPN